MIIKLANQIFKKIVKMYISDDEATLSSELNFYKEDALNIYFYIQSLNFETTEQADDSISIENQAVPLTGVSAKMLIKVPEEVPISVESVNINSDNSIEFRFTVPYVNYVGTTKMQIVLTDSQGNILHLPPVNVSIREPIGLLDDSDITHNQTISTFRYSTTIDASQFTLEGERYYVDITHTIQGTDGNVFISVIDSSTSQDIPHVKKIIDSTHFRLYLEEAKSVKVSVRG